jgi:hypothetical protein
MSVVVCYNALNSLDVVKLQKFTAACARVLDLQPDMQLKALSKGYYIAFHLELENNMLLTLRNGC